MTDLSPAMQMQCHRVSQKACDTIFGLLTDGWKMQESKTTPTAWASTRWIGHISYAPDPCGVLYRTKREAKDAGWDHPTRVNVTIAKIVRTS